MKLSELTKMSPVDIANNMELIAYKPITRNDEGDISKVILEYRPKDEEGESIPSEPLFRNKGGLR